MRRAIFIVSTLSLLLALSATAQAAPRELAGNLLVNPGFEGLYSKQCCENTNQFQVNTPIQQVQVAFGWTAWWIEPDASHPNQCPNCTPYSRPEFRYSTLVHTGSSSQQYFTTYSIHEAGLYQQVAGVKPGQKLQFSVYMLAFSSKDNPWQIRVGIDPTGGIHPFSSSIVWGPSYGFSNGAWVLYTAEAVAQNSTVTVFTYSRPSWAYESNSMYVDDASLAVFGEGAGTVSGPAPTAYILNSNDSGVVISPSGTAMPAAGTSPGTGATSYVVQRGDNLYRISLKYGTTVAALKTANGLASDIIRIGQVLIIPGK